MSSEHGGSCRPPPLPTASSYASLPRFDEKVTINASAEANSIAARMDPKVYSVTLTRCVLQSKGHQRPPINEGMHL